MTRRKTSCIGLGGIGTLAVCASLLSSACRTTPATVVAVRHVLLLWLKHPERAAERAQLVRAAHSLRMMPGVLRVESLHFAPAPPPGVDPSFDLAIVITFRDRAALAHYENNPRHIDALRDYLQPLVRRAVAYNLSGR